MQFLTSAYPPFTHLLLKPFERVGGRPLCETNVGLKLFVYLCGLRLIVDDWHSWNAAVVAELYSSSRLRKAVGVQSITITTPSFCL